MEEMWFVVNDFFKEGMELMEIVCMDNVDLMLLLLMFMLFFMRCFGGVRSIFIVLWFRD